MSFNQSRGADSQYPKSGNRSGNASASSYQQINTNSAKPSSGPPGSYQKTNSYKKFNNVHRGQSRGNNGSSVNPEFSNMAVLSQNGLGQQIPPRGVADAPISTASTGTKAPPPAPNSNAADPKSPQSASVSSDPKLVQIPPKTEGGPPKGFSLQFGSISPGFVNGIMIPPRTSSAPPDLDEQKHDQAQRDSSKTAPPVPLPSILKHQLPMKEPNAVKHPVTPLQSVKEESQVSSPSPSSPQRPYGPVSSMSMHVPFNLPQVPVQIGIPPQFPTQTLPSTSLQMPGILPRGNGPLLQQPIFVPLIQPHLMQHHGIMHHGQGINFRNQMGLQLPHQMSNMVNNLGHQFTPPQAGNFGSYRRAVKITHPETREEIRLDRQGETKTGVSPKVGIHNTAPPKTQPVLPFVAPHQSNYSLSSSNSSGYPPSMSVPLSTQTAPGSQISRPPYTNNQGPQITVSSNPSAAIKITKSEHSHGEHLDLENTRNVPTSSLSTNSTTEKDITSKLGSITSNVANKLKQIGNSNVKLLNGANVTTPAIVGSKNFTGVDTSLLVKSLTSAHTQFTSNEGSKNGSIKDQVKKPVPDEHHQSLSQGGGEGIAPLTATLPSDDKSSRIIEGTATIALSGPTKVVETASSDDYVSPVASGFPKITISTSTSSGESGEQVGCFLNKAMELVSDQVNEGTNEDVAINEVSSVDAEIQAREAQKGFLESMEVISLNAADVDLVKSTVTEKSVTTSDDTKPLNTGLESKSTESLKEATTNHIDAMNSTKGPNDKAPLELYRPNSATAKGKKKMKEVLQKADAAGSTSDLYTAYKHPEEKENVLSAVATRSRSSNVDVNQVPVYTKDDTLAGKNQTHSKSEPENWEDAEDITSPKMKIAAKFKSSLSRSSDNANEPKKYTRDFLLKFKDQCYILPENFSIPQELLRVLVASNMSSNGRVSAADRSNGTPRSEWSNKGSASFSSRDQRTDYGYGNNIARPSSGGNSGGHRHPKGQVGGQNSGGILSGSLQSLNSFNRESAGADMWHRGTNFKKGLISSPQTPAPIMHKAERKYELGKVTDEEQAKQRQIKGILNKLTPQNFGRLFEQVKAVNIDNAVTLTGVISQIFDKALMEPTFCEMYADFCQHLAGELPDFTEGDEKITFKRVLLNKCQEEFERGEREQEEVNKVEEEGEVALSNEETEEKRVKARRRMLGNIRLIGELYKKRMLTERIMHECIKKLLGPQQNADEEDIESLCKLMSTIGEMIDHPKAKTHMDAYFGIMLALSNNMKYSSRVRFMLKDSIDLRRNRWQQRRKVEGPKKIDEVHRDAAHERQVQSSRLPRGPSMNVSARRGASTDFGPRGSSLLPSPNSQTGEYRSFPSQDRGLGGTQDVRMDDRQSSYENRNVSVPLPQRGAGNDTVTLGPQGGLARGMSMRGAPSAHLTTPYRGLDGYRPATERPAYNSNNNALPISSSGRLVVPAYSQPAVLERNTSLENEIRNPGRDADRPEAIDPAHHNQTLPEERLRHMSTATIKEFYSAKDEKEVALCLKDMNTPSFYPSMIALWITDSFERKDIERNLLNRLLVSLAKAQDRILSQNDLLGGFESVLTNLEDAVNDAPRAPEFLGRILATMVVENLIPVGVVGDMVHKGGEEPGSLVESGVAGDVIGNILEAIQSEKGDSYLNEVRSNLKLEDFRPPNPLKSRKLENFL